MCACSFICKHKHAEVISLTQSSWSLSVWLLNSTGAVEMPKVSSLLYASLITTSNYLPGSSSLPASLRLSNFFSIKVNTSGSQQGQPRCKFPFFHQSAIQFIHADSVHNLEIISSSRCTVSAVLLLFKFTLPRSITLIAFKGTNAVNWAALVLNSIWGPWRPCQPELIWIQLESSAAIIAAKGQVKRLWQQRIPTT